MYLSDSKKFPVLTLRNMIITPNVITPVIVGRENSIESVENAYVSEHQEIVCVPQKNDEIEIPKANDLFRVGTLANIVQLFRLPEGNLRVLLEGKERITVNRYFNRKGILQAKISFTEKVRSAIDQNELKAMHNMTIDIFKEYVNLNYDIPEEIIDSLNKKDDPLHVFYFVLNYLQVDYLKKQEIIEEDDLLKSYEKMLKLYNKEIEIQRLEKNIAGKVKNKLEKTQREYFLNEQLKIIRQELGKAKEGKTEWEVLKEKIEKTNLSKEARKRAEEELLKLSRIPQHAQEYTVIHKYLNTLLELPWNKPKRNDIDIKKAENILNKDHYGLKKVKERIIEYLAVLQLSEKIKGQILCFVGPPGVGKTSLGKSIAKALKRKFIGLSLGGVRDEAEIRGHRRTYIGSMPGIIMQSMKKAQVKNPVILMDEVDKVSRDFRGDPASALLEVLDPEQNENFRDHYLNFGYDLSEVLFITTANTTASIPAPLLDRMEIIHLPGYTQFEKFHIANKHLIPKIFKQHKISNYFKLNFRKKAIEAVIDNYTRESGVRNLERNLAKITRKVVKDYLEEKFKTQQTVKKNNLKKYLGAPKRLYPELNKKDTVGVATGLAWTSTGGETLEVEVLKLAGEGKLKITGQLGDVMKESAYAALSFARRHYKKYHIPNDFNKKYDLHLHVPEGAIPKDGPSAGITIVTAIISALSEIKVRYDVAMTGEITLSGKILPIGGLEEKLIAAKQAKIKNVLIPQKNDAHLDEVNKEIKKGLNIVMVNKVDEALDFALRK